MMRRVLGAIAPRDFAFRVLAFLAAIGAVKLIGEVGADPGAHPDYDVDLDGTGTPASETQTGVTPPTPGGPDPNPAAQPRPAGEVPGAVQTGQDQRGQPPQHVPYRRFSEVNQRFETEREARIRAETEARLLRERYESQPAPSSGPEETPEDREIRENLERLYPALTKLKDLPFDKLMTALERVDSIDANDTARWEEVGRQVWQRLDTQVQEHFGAPIEDPETRAMIDDAFQNWLRRSKDAQAMYLRQDPQLVPTFWSRYTAGIVKPAVRKAEAETVTAAQNRQPRAPRGGSSTTVTAAPRQPSVKNPDELHDAAADAFLARRG